VLGRVRARVDDEVGLVEPRYVEISKPASFSVLIPVAGTTLIASISCDLSAEIIASSFENIRRPNSSIFGFVPQ
jgi:hypothetical protein